MNIVNKDKIKTFKEFDDHFCVYLLKNPKIGLEGFIAIHRKNKNIPSFGATRLWHYKSPEDGLSDALRLSKIMSYKAALAGLPCGGAKGVIIIPRGLSDDKRRELLLAYADEVNKLEGEFITGADVGMSEEDIKIMREVSDFFVGVNSDATVYTSIGICTAIETSFEFIEPDHNLAEKNIAIQGLGKIGQAVLRVVYPKMGQIFVTDICQAKIDDAKEKYPRISITTPSEIHKQDVDVFSPCALAHAVTIESVNELKCRVIVGGANNQLQNDIVGDKLFMRDILYAPDYVANAGGLISVYDEYENPRNYSHERILKKIAKIRDTLLDIFSESKKRDVATNRIANERAEQIFNSY